MGSSAIAIATSDVVSTYHRKAKDFHRPAPATVARWMPRSFRPCADPILKPCEVYLSAWQPRLRKNHLDDSVDISRINISEKKRPGSSTHQMCIRQTWTGRNARSLGEAADSSKN